MHWFNVSFTVLAVVATGGHASFLRFACSQLVTERLDPLVHPGDNPGGHMHQIVGGNAFNVSMGKDMPERATCTTCTFSEDFSNYWTAVLYFRHKNGSFKRVPQLPNQLLESQVGGMTVYYNAPTDKTVNVTAFKPGFRMLAGDPSRRYKEPNRINLYRCYTGKGLTPNPGGVATTDTKDMPKKYCQGGIRVNTFFPSCWDGKNLDSPDHQSHVSYGNGNYQCTPSHPVVIPQIFIETIWATGLFPQSMWPEDGSDPYVWSSGDQTGFGHHADYVFGWKGNVLQQAIDARCSAQSCPSLKTQGYPAANKCTMKQHVQENLDEWLTELPGGIPIA